MVLTLNGVLLPKIMLSILIIIHKVKEMLVVKNQVIFTLILIKEMVKNINSNLTMVNFIMKMILL